MQIVAYGGGVTIAGSAHARLGLSGITFRPIEEAVLRYRAVHASSPLPHDLDRLLSLAKSLAARDQEWFARQRLIRPEHRLLQGTGRHGEKRGLIPAKALSQDA